MKDLYTAMAATDADRAQFKRIDDIKSVFSNDPDTPLGIVVTDETNKVLCIGYNSLPAGVKPDPLRLSRPGPDHPEGDNGKYDWLNHAERKAICHAARDGVALKGKTMYMALMPCIQCAAAVIDAGIAEVVLDHEYTESYRRRGNKWEFDFQRVATMFSEAGIRVRAVKL